MLFITNTVRLLILISTALSVLSIEEFLQYSNNQTKFIGDEAQYNCTFNVSDNGAVYTYGAASWEYKFPSTDTFLLLGSVTPGDNFTLLTEGVELGHSSLVVENVSLLIFL